MKLDDLHDLLAEESELVEFKVLSRTDALPDILIGDLKQAEEITRTENENEARVLAGAFLGDKAWLYEGLRLTQPLTYQAFMKASDPFVLLSTDISGMPFPGVGLWTLVESHGQLVVLDLPSGLIKEIVAGYRRLDAGPMVVSSIGSKLAVAYFGRLTGCGFPNKMPPSPIRWRGLISPISDWQPLDKILLGTAPYRQKGRLSAGQTRKHLKEPLEHFARQFAIVAKELRVNRSGGAPFLIGSLRALIDTRVASDDMATFDVVLIQTPDDESEVEKDASGVPLFFHMKDGDWRNIRVLENPVDVIDQFVASALTSTAERFDFSKFTRAL